MKEIDRNMRKKRKRRRKMREGEMKANLESRNSEEKEGK